MTDTQRRLERIYPPKIMFAVVNPLMRWLLGTSLGRKLPDLARLEFTGRKTGRDIRLVTGLHDVDGRKAILTNSGWRHNFEGGRPATAIIGGEPYPVIGTLQSDPDAVADVYQAKIEELGPKQSPRRLGIEIPEGPPPTHDELADLVRREGMSVIYLEPAGD